MDEVLPHHAHLDRLHAIHLGAKPIHEPSNGIVDERQKIDLHHSDWSDRAVGNTPARRVVMGREEHGGRQRHTRREQAVTTGVAMKLKHRSGRSGGPTARARAHDHVVRGRQPYATK